MTRSRRLLLIGCFLLIVGAAVFLSWAMRATPHVRDRVVEALNQRFESQVDLQSIDAAIFPSPRVGGTGLALRR